MMRVFIFSLLFICLSIAIPDYHPNLLSEGIHHESMPSVYLETRQELSVALENEDARYQLEYHEGNKVVIIAREKVGDYSNGRDGKGHTLFGFNNLTYPVYVIFKLAGTTYPMTQNGNSYDHTGFTLPASMTSFGSSGFIPYAQTGDIVQSNSVRLYPDYSATDDGTQYQFPIDCRRPNKICMTQNEQGHVFKCKRNSNVEERCTSRNCRPTHELEGSASEEHAIDWSAPSGTDLKAARAGTVLFTKDNLRRTCRATASCRCDSNEVMIRHSDGTIALYVHLKKNSIPDSVTIGSTVNAGDKIGEVGNVGCSSGPHLHYGIIYFTVSAGQLHMSEVVPSKPSPYRCGQTSRPASSTPTPPARGLPSDPLGDLMGI